LHVILKPTGYFKKYLNEDEEYWSFEVEEPITAEELLEKSKIDLKELPSFSVLVNGRQKSLDCMLHDGDRVVVLSPISGG